MGTAVKLVGLDCGSTTSSIVVATARLSRRGGGRTHIEQIEDTFRSPLVFTPFEGDRIDAARLKEQLDAWLDDAQLAPREIFGGGALITGLAAQRANAAAVASLIEARMADALIATANDPSLESWLAFMGNCHELSQAHPGMPILNLDIGGGTTNLALGLDGQVLATGCLFVGARHFQCLPGTFQLTGVSTYGSALCRQLAIDRKVGDALGADDVERIVDFYVALLLDAIVGTTRLDRSPAAQLHVQVPFARPADLEPEPVITLSGGVGQLVYEELAERAVGGTTPFGDLGLELARRIAATPAIVERMRFTPRALGHATVYGLMRHSTELSGPTIYLPHPGRLPLRNVPILGQISADTSEERLAAVLALVRGGGQAACLAVDLAEPTAGAIRDLGNRLAAHLATDPLPPSATLVLMASGNFGKALGNYVSRWGTLEIDLIVVDEVPIEGAQFVRLGRAHEGIVPVRLLAI
jgi:ethanolamine utilization protein EutA